MAISKSIPPVSKDTQQNQEVDGVLSGTAWELREITYSFPNDPADYGNGYSEAGTGFEAFLPAQQQAIRGILGSIESLTDLRFQDLTGTQRDGSATLRFAETDKTIEAWSYYPSERENGGDAWFNNSFNLFESPTVGSYAYATFMHEVGHTLGLKHSFENGSFGVVPEDSLEYTVMSYSSDQGLNDWLNAPLDYPQTLMMYDIAALQKMYGADYTQNSGNTTYSWNPLTGAMTASGVNQQFDAPGTDTIFMTLWDGGGTDTYDFSKWQTDLHIDLRPGEWVAETGTSPTHTANLNGEIDGADPRWAEGLVANALMSSGGVLSLVENAKGGSGDDTLVANQAVNTLTGSGGQDIFTWESLADLQNSGVKELDTIADFGQGDKIDLEDLGISFAHLSVTTTRGVQYLQGNIDSDEAPEFSIRVQGRFDIAAHWGTPDHWVLV